MNTYTCKTCNDKHYIHTWNTLKDKEDIQKCNDCGIYKSNEEAYHGWLFEGFVRGKI